MKRSILVLIPPIIIGVICAIISSFWLEDGINLLRLEFVLNALITCAVTFSGIILTSVSILIGFSSSPLMKHIRVTGGLKELRVRYTESLVLGLIIIIFCIAIGANTDITNHISFKWSVIGVGLIVTYGASMFSTGFYLLGVIGLLPAESPIITRNTPSTPRGDFRVN